MDKRGCMMMRVLINRYNSKAGNALLKFLPEEESKNVMAQDIQSEDAAPLIHQPQNVINDIHYSWIQLILQNFPQTQHQLVLAALTPVQIAGLKVATPLPISHMGKTFILEQIYRFLKFQDHLPLEYLPITVFSPLGKWKKNQLLNLCDFLGLHDLASEVRHIVNRTYLKNIYTCLTSKQFHYLKICLHTREKLTSPKMGVDPAKQECPKLKQMIHHRGLIRLGKTLCGQHPDLLWHIAHVLDVNRGNILLKEYQPQEIPKVTNILKQQLLDLMAFLEKP